jgi:hypothetical protein
MGPPPLTRRVQRLEPTETMSTGLLLSLYSTRLAGR